MIVSKRELQEVSISEKIMVSDAKVTNAMTKSVMTQHKLGHMSMQWLNVLLNRNLLPGLRSTNVDFCEASLYGKHNKDNFPLATSKGSNVSELIHSNS